MCASAANAWAAPASNAAWRFSGVLAQAIAGALENSNVDLTEQLVGLMEGQRNYQANTRVLTTNKELIQSLFNAI